MALQFRRTDAPLGSSPADDREDRTLHCGPWIVGRVREDTRPIGLSVVFTWSLTGPYVPGDVMTNHSEAGTLEEKVGLVDAFQRWSVWAGAAGGWQRAGRAALGADQGRTPSRARDAQDHVRFRVRLAADVGRLYGRSRIPAGRGPAA